MATSEQPRKEELSIYRTTRMMRYLIDRREVRVNIALARYLDGGPELRAAMVARMNVLLADAGSDIVVPTDVMVSTERHEAL